MSSNTATFGIKKDYSISCARAVALNFVLLCHFLGNLGYGWASSLNVGVQMFLFISGYLYGKKAVIRTLEFYKKSARKLLIDYYLFISFVLFAYRMTDIVEVSDFELIGMFTFTGGLVDGLGHLWYVKTILICYLLTPMLFKFINWLDRFNTVVFVTASALLMAVLHLVIGLLLSPSVAPEWIVCFILGMVFSRLKKRKIKIVAEIIPVVIVIPVVVFNFVMDESLYNYSRVIVGIAAVIITRFLFRKTVAPQVGELYLLDITDKYSYDNYLTHHIYVAGPISMLVLIHNHTLAVMVALMLTMLSTIVLNWMSEYLRNPSFGKSHHFTKRLE